MAKLKSPLFSISASGSIGDVLTYSSRRSGSQVRFQSRPLYKLTLERSIQRELYLSAVSSWNNLSSVDKSSWRSSARGLNMSGYNLYILNYLLIPNSYYGIAIYGVSIYGEV